MVKFVTTNCEHCGKEFQISPYMAKNDRGRFCSNTCRSLARRNRKVFSCEVCGIRFERPLSAMDHYGGVKYCSKDCAYKSKNKKIQVPCAYCGRVFEISAHKLGKRKYCSDKCKYMGQIGVPSPLKGLERPKTADRIKCTCLTCGKSFEVLKSQRKEDKGAKYCSQRCRGLGIRGANSPMWKGGSKKDRGPNWHHQRKLAYERDGGICQACRRKPKSGERRFSVHHIRPFREFNGDYEKANELSNLITLCEHCHPKAEYGKISIQPKLL